MSYLLDTNVISELRKGQRADAGVLAWLGSVPEAELYLSVLVVGELRQGVERLRRRDPRSAEKLDQWLATLTSRYETRIFVVDAHVAELWGRLNVSDPLPSVDGLLAATALAHGLTLVTRNTRDVDRSGAEVLNPFAKP